TSPSCVKIKPLSAPQRRTAFSNRLSNTRWRSNVECPMISRTSEVAACCSCASFSSRVWQLSFSCRSTTDESPVCVDVDAPLGVALVALRPLVFAVLRLGVRCLTWPSSSTGGPYPTTALAMLCDAANWVARCPLWVKSRHPHCTKSCPLYPRKRTYAVQQLISAMGQKRTSTSQQRTFGLSSLLHQSIAICVPVTPFNSRLRWKLVR